MRSEREVVRCTDGRASASADGPERLHPLYFSGDKKAQPLASPTMILAQAHAWTRTLVEQATQDRGTHGKEYSEGREHESSDDCRQRNEVDNDEQRDGPSIIADTPSITSGAFTESEHDQDPQHLENDLQQIVALLLIDPILINMVQCDSAKTSEGASSDKDSTDSSTNHDRFAKLSNRLNANADIAIANLEDFVFLKRWTTKLKQMEDEDRLSEEAVQYKQFGVITKHLSAVIEIGEDGNGSSCAGGPSPTSIVETPKLRPPEQETKKEEMIFPDGEEDAVILMSHTVSDMTTESFVRTASTSSVSSAVTASQGTDQDFKQDHRSKDITSPPVVDALPSQDDDSSFYSIASITQMKKDVAEALHRAGDDGDFSPASSTTDRVDNRTNTGNISTKDKQAVSSKSNASTKHKRNVSKVSFAESIVSEVRERPRIDPKVVKELFYSHSDIDRFEDEAYDSDGFSVSSSYSYTSLTPNSSYQGSDYGSEDENDTTPTPAAPESKDFIGANIANDIADVFLYKDMSYKDILDKSLKGLAN
mmetsp:Transcript_19198/g.38701  ORF Transcript_19198/g.38701 Transcript_19198/m.38701 type:complete len:536 (+) Transcript_19198:241-1848(+)